jgi:hypothetical protein
MAKAKNTKGHKKKGMKRVARKKRTPRFGPVTTINTAPVAIGNSVRGSKPHVMNSADGCRVIGRDFAFEAKGTVAAANNWSLIGGMPLTPAVLATSSLRSYAQMFSNFKINRLVVHYITSSPTSQAGDIMFYYERERNSPMVDFTNSSFLPFVLSDPNTVIGPQWQNHSVSIDPVKEWKNTNYGLQSDLNEESVGSVFLFSKTSSANSPGYLLVDFDITFKEMCVNPRAGIIPITRGLWNYVTIGKTNAGVTKNGLLFLDLAGNNPDGTLSTLPNGSMSGDVYKIVLLVTNSTVSGVNAPWTNVTTASLLGYSTGGNLLPVTVDDGFTCYGVLIGNTYMMYPNLEAAKAQTGGLVWGLSATVDLKLCTMMSLVATNNTNSQSAY